MLQSVQATPRESGNRRAVEPSNFVFPMRLFFVTVLFLISLPPVPAHSANGDPEVTGVMLSWQNDPTSTMTIDWHQTAAGPAAQLFVRREGTGDEAWTAIAASESPFPHSTRRIFRAEVPGLQADTRYEFRLAPHPDVHVFRTMPSTLDRPVRLAVGGDVGQIPSVMERTGREAARYDPDVVVFGGDLAYADGLPENVDRWYEFFDVLTRSLVTDDGRRIPVLAAIGNHEVVDGYFRWHSDYEDTDAWRESVAPYYFALFAFPGHPGYGVLDFGDYLSLVLLDSEHVNPTDGAQAVWLENTLAARAHVPFVFPVYHVPAFPSTRSGTEYETAQVLLNWLPAFDRHGILLAFEHHDHAYKRTHPIRDGKMDDRGTVYVGDGAWGAHLREIGQYQDVPPWYIDRAISRYHFNLVTLQPGRVRVTSIADDGEILDRFDRLTAKTTAAEAPLAGSWALGNHPNPAGLRTTITYHVESTSHVRLQVFDAAGRLLATLADRSHAPGTYHNELSTGEFAAGVYFYRLEADGMALVRPLVVSR
jgi:acid phosphatase type 7